MKKFNLILLLLVLIYSCLGMTILVNFFDRYNFFYPTEGKWKLVWNDEFDGLELDSKKWITVYRSIGNSSFQNSTQANFAENVTVKDGCLILANQGMNWSEERPRDEHSYERYYYISYYTSGQIITRDAWNYGRFEIRAKIPSGEGVLSYASLFPADEKVFQEIFIMRIYGNHPSKVSMGDYLETTQPRRYLEKAISSKGWGPDYSAAFHTFAVEWEPGRIQWYIDDILIYQTKRNIPRTPLSLSLGTSVGGSSADDPYAGRIAPLPQCLNVD